VFCCCALANTMQTVRRVSRRVNALARLALRECQLGSKSDALLFHQHAMRTSHAACSVQTTIARVHP